MGANYIVQFDITEDKNLVIKNVVNALNHKIATYVTRQVKNPHFDRATHPLRILDLSRRPQSRSS